MTTITTSTLSGLALDSQVVTSVDVELSGYVTKDNTDISSNMTLGEMFKKLATDLGHTWVEV